MIGESLTGATRAEFPAMLGRLGYVYGAEVGVEQGQNAARILTGWRGRLLLVDCWAQQPLAVYCDQAAYWSDADQEANYQKTLAAMAPFGGRATVRRMMSAEAAGQLADGELDFVYLDANHEYSAVLAELALWYPKVRRGGMISGHDFLDAGRPFGVASAVREFVRELPVALEVAPEDWANWHFVKP